MRCIMLVTLISIAALVSGCTRATEEDLIREAAAAYREGDPERAFALYEECLEEYPDGPLRPEATFAMASIVQNDRRDLTSALRLYRLVADRFPDHPRAPGALFLIGFIYHNELKQLDSARAGYQEFLARYPDHPMAASAAFELANLGRDPSSFLTEETAAGQEAPPGRAKRR